VRANVVKTLEAVGSPRRPTATNRCRGSDWLRRAGGSDARAAAPFG